MSQYIMLYHNTCYITHVISYYISSHRALVDAVQCLRWFRSASSALSPRRSGGGSGARLGLILATRDIAPAHTHTHTFLGV